MAEAVIPRISIQADDFDVSAETDLITGGRPDIGAIVAFTGLCRDENGTLSALELEHYPFMAEAEISRIAGEAASRWPLSALTVVHRHGKVEPGEKIVLVIAASRHRQAAFDAASFLMDFLKTRAPFWKKEHRTDGTVGGWVEARSADDNAMQRWAKETDLKKS